MRRHTAPTAGGVASPTCRLIPLERDPAPSRVVRVVPAKRGGRVRGQGPGSSDGPCKQQRQEERQRLLRRQPRHDSQHPPPPLASSPSAAAHLEALVNGSSSKSSSSGNSAEPERAAAAGQPWLSPRMALLAAAALWGSYTVSVRLLYSTADPPDTAVIMACRGLLQAAAMLAISSSLLAPQAGESAASVRPRQQGGQGPAALLHQLVTLEAPPLWLAAAELGLWNYTATSLQTLGLTLTSATRASFLIQATVMLTPLLSLLAGFRPGRRVWAGCALALAGTLLVTADEAGGGGGGAAGHLGGDSAILASALFYSLGVVRLSGYARSLQPSRIAVSKSLVLGGLAAASLAWTAGGCAARGEPLGVLWGGAATDPLCWAALLWSGLGPGALASFLHAKGQKDIAPAEAQVIFSSKPLWAVGLAWLLLGGEELGPFTWAGGAALMAAGLLASSGQQDKNAASAAERGAGAQERAPQPQPQPVLARRSAAERRERQ